MSGAKSPESTITGRTGRRVVMTQSLSPWLSISQTFAHSWCVWPFRHIGSTVSVTREHTLCISPLSIHSALTASFDCIHGSLTSSYRRHMRIINGPSYRAGSKESVTEGHTFPVWPLPMNYASTATVKQIHGALASSHSRRLWIITGPSSKMTSWRASLKGRPFTSRIYLWTTHPLPLSGELVEP